MDTESRPDRQAQRTVASAPVLEANGVEKSYRRVALTARAPDIAAGEWEATAAPVTEQRQRRAPRPVRPRRPPKGLGLVPSWPQL